MKRPIETVYVLRFWAEESRCLPHKNWRFVLQDPQTGQRVGFTTLEALTRYLLQQAEQTTRSNHNDPENKNSTDS